MSMPERDEKLSVIETSKSSILSALNIFFRRTSKRMTESQGDTELLGIDSMKEILQKDSNEWDEVSQEALTKLLDLLKKEGLSVKSLMQQIDLVLISIEGDEKISPQYSKKLIEALSAVFQTLVEENNKRFRFCK